MFDCTLRSIFISFTLFFVYSLYFSALWISDFMEHKEKSIKIISLFVYKTQVYIIRFCWVSVFSNRIMISWDCFVFLPKSLSFFSFLCYFSILENVLDQEKCVFKAFVDRNSYACWISRKTNRLHWHDIENYSDVNIPQMPGFAFFWI